MKRYGILLIAALLLCMGCAHAQTQALPHDAYIYAERTMPDGAVVLERMDRVLPAGTLCSVEQIAETDVNRSITSMVYPFHRFARVSYHNEYGQIQEAWIMLHDLNRAMSQNLETPDAVQAYARRFFTNQYVMAADEKTNITHFEQGDGWRAELRNETGVVTHYVVFDALGHVAQYRDTSLELPDIKTGIAYSETLSDAADESGARAALEWISKELFPDVGFNSVPCYFLDEERDAYTFLIDTFDFYITIQAGPQPRLLAYGDLRLQEGAYPGYLTHGEAAVRGEQAIRDAFALADDARVDAVQVSFYISEQEWIAEDSPAVKWEMMLRAFTGEAVGEFWISLDAETGEMIPVEPETGNG